MFIAVNIQHSPITDPVEAACRELLVASPYHPGRFIGTLSEISDRVLREADDTGARYVILRPVAYVDANLMHRLDQ